MVENIFLLPFGAGESEDQEGNAFFGVEGVGVYAAVELPAGNIEEGSASIGPVAGIGVGPLSAVANLFVEIPFTDDEDPGLAYALAVSADAFELEPAEFAVGFEAHGSAEGAFGDAVPLGEQGHYIGPALYGEFQIEGSREIEPRLAILFGLTDESTDAIASLNLEIRY